MPCHLPCFVSLPRFVFLHSMFQSVWCLAIPIKMSNPRSRGWPVLLTAISPPGAVLPHGSHGMRVYRVDEQMDEEVWKYP